MRLIWDDPETKLSVLCAGPLPAPSIELMTPTRFEEILLILRSVFDYVVVDSPSLQKHPDGIVLAAKADMVLLVVRAWQPPRQSIYAAQTLLRNVGRQPTKVVLNGI
jgi:Mrp family chromosome partitioning ATPase